MVEMNGMKCKIKDHFLKETVYNFCKHVASHINFSPRHFCINIIFSQRKLLIFF